MGPCAVPDINRYKVADVTGNVPQDVKGLACNTLASYGFARNGDDALGVGEALEITKVDSLNRNARNNDRLEVVVECGLVVRRSTSKRTVSDPSGPPTHNNRRVRWLDRVSHGHVSKCTDNFLYSFFRRDSGDEEIDMPS